VGTLGIHEHTVEIDGKTITFETGTLAMQAGGAVVTSLGDTKVLSTTTASKQPKDFLPFFPSPSRWRSACTPTAGSPARSSSARGVRPRTPSSPAA
jgi:hypothetical protein